MRGLLARHTFALLNRSSDEISVRWSLRSANRRSAFGMRSAAAEDARAREALIAGAALLAGVATGYVLRPLLRRLRGLALDGAAADAEWEMLDGPYGAAAGEAEEDEEGEEGEECKLVLCVRTDLKMQRGKIAAQVGHATLGAYKRALRRAPAAVRAWERGAQPKIALQIRSAAEADRLEAAAKRAAVPTYKVFDAGRTQIAAGSMTVLAIGPAAVSKVNSVTGHLKLL